MNLPGFLRFDHHMREVLRGASVAFVTKAFGSLLTFAFNILAARQLGADQVGVFFLALTAANIAVVFGRVGLDNALLRFVSANAAVNDWSALKGAYGKGMSIAFLASAAIALIIFCLAPVICGGLLSKPELIRPMRWISLAVVPLSVMTIHAETLKGLKRVFEAIVLQEHGALLYGLMLVGMGILWWCRSMNTMALVVLFIVAAFLSALISTLMWRRATSHARTIRGRFRTSVLLSSGIPLLVVAALNLAMYWAPSILLGVWCRNADVGIFNVAVQLSMLTSFVLISVNSIAAPKFSALFVQRDMAGLGRLARNSAKLMTALAIPVLIVFIVFPAWVMRLIGPQFVPGAMVLTILAAGQFVNVVTGSVGYLLIMSENERLIRNTVILTAVVSLILNFILIPVYGIIGAAVATAISLSIKNLLAAYLVWERLGIQTIPLLPIEFRQLGHGSVAVSPEEDGSKPERIS